MCFMQYRDSKCRINNVTFIENTAEIGGAIYADQYVFYGEQMETLRFSGTSLEHSIIHMTSAFFLKNSAANGGALQLNNVPAVFEDVKMADNTAQQNGGSLLLKGLRDRKSVV